MKNERRVVTPGPQPIEHTLRGAELRLNSTSGLGLSNVLDNPYRPLTTHSSVNFGPALRSASGTVYLAERMMGPPEGDVTFQIDCPAGT